VTDALLRASPHLALIDAAVSVAALLVMVIFSPLLLRVIWSSTPLPDGELRRRLEGLCRRHNFHCRDILVWHTYNHLGNAGVMGPMPFLRYVVLTDALLERCTESEVEAIFAHEIGHVRHHHLPFYMLFALAFGGLYVNLIDLLEPTGWVEPLQKLLSFEMTPSQAAVMLGFAIVYWVLVFGFVSRRMEQQADLFALCATGDPGAFLSALAKLSLMSGTPRRIPFWRHFSIERRLRFLTDVIETPALAAAFRARVFAMQGALVLIFAAALVRLALLGPSLLGA
jgi:Zn-dependent protease with chaperone function